MTNLTETAFTKLETFTDTDMKKRARIVLESFARQLDTSGIDTPVDVFEGDDSVSVEWIFDDLRIGIGLETNKDDDGWFLISSKKAGCIDALGSLVDTDLAVLLKWLISFVKQNKDMP